MCVNLNLENKNLNVPLRSLQTKDNRFWIPSSYCARPNDSPTNMSTASVSRLAYEIGDEIFRSEPWIFSILSSKLRTHCYQCLQRPVDGKEVRRCGGCLLAGYCSENCQKTDWKPRHRDECMVLKRFASDNLSGGQNGLPEDDLDRLMVLLKIIGKLKRKEIGDARNACQSKLATGRTFLDLMSHESELLRHRPNLPPSYHFLKPYIDSADPEQKICPDFLTFVRLWGKFIINNFAIYELQHPTVTAVGRGIYLQPLILDHSCIPNALQCNIGKTVLIHAIRPIKNKQDVRIAYMSAFDLVQTRRSYLEKMYFFICDCAACTDVQLNSERNSMLCVNNACLIPIPLAETSGLKSCPSCGANNSDQFKKAETATSQLCKALLDFQQRKLGDKSDHTAELKKAIDEGITCLYPTNFTLGVAHKETAGLLSEDESRLDESMESLLRSVISRREHIRDYCFQPCFLVLKWLVEKNRDREALALASQVGDFFKTVAGNESTLYKTWCENVSNL